MLQLLNIAPLVASAALLQTATPATPADDSVMINAGIAAALKAGKKEYVLPAGVVNLRKPINIFEGVRNFTLRGASNGSTIIKTPVESLNVAIYVGCSNLQLHNNWGITNRPNYAMNAAAEGSDTIVAKVNFTPTIGGYYVFYDKSVVNAFGDPSASQVMNHAEIVQIKSYDAATRKIKIDRPLGRAYDATATLADVNACACVNVTVKDISFDGLLPNRSGSGGLITASLSEGITLSNLKVTNFTGWAATLSNCRNSVVDNVQVSNALAGGPGAGYGVTVTRSRFVDVRNSTATSTRHGFVIHGGSLDVNFTDLVAKDCTIDTHGMDERRMNFVRCTSNAALSLGNGAWQWGDSDVKVQDCDLGGIELNAGSKRVAVTNTNIGVLSLLGSDEAAPDAVTLTDCNLSNADNVVRENGAAKKIDFTRCRFEATRGSWGNVMAFRGFKGQLTFDACDFVANSIRVGDCLFYVESAAADAKVTIRNSRFYGAVMNDAAVTGTQYASVLAGGLAGRYEFQNNRFYTSYKNVWSPSVKATFLVKQGAVNALEQSNSVVQTTQLRPGTNQP